MKLKIKPFDAYHGIIPMYISNYSIIKSGINAIAVYENYPFNPWPQFGIRIRLL